MGDNKNIVFHIGLHKTGTTSIQIGFLQNQKALLEQGIYFPKSCTEDNQLQIIHSNLPWEILGHKGFTPNLGTLRELKEEISKVNYKNIIVTSEGLSRLKDPSELLSHFSQFNLKIVFYVRRQDLIAPSRYTEDLKFGYSQSFDTWLKTKSKGYFNFNRIYRLWSPHADETVVRVLDKDRFIGGNIVNDFLVSTNCLNEAAYDFSTASNQRIGAVSVFALLEFNKLMSSYSNTYSNISGNMSLINRFRSIVNGIVNDSDISYNPFDFESGNNYLQLFEKSNSNLFRKTGQKGFEIVTSQDYSNLVTDSISSLPAKQQVIYLSIDYFLSILAFLLDKNYSSFDFYFSKYMNALGSDTLALKNRITKLVEEINEFIR